MLPAAVADVMEIGAEGRYNFTHHVVDVNRAPEALSFERALAHAIAVWPILGCRFDDSASWPRFEPLGLSPRDVLVHEEVDDLAGRTRGFVEEAPSIRERSPMLLALFRHRAGARLVLKLHHGVSDAVGGIELLRLLGAVAYGQDTVMPEAGVRRVIDLASHERTGSRWQMARALWGQVASWKEAIQISKRAPPLGRPKDGQPRRFGVHTVTLDDDTTQLVIRRAGGPRSLGSSLIAAALMLTSDRYRAGGHEAERLGVFFTIDLRRHFQRGARTLANLTSVEVLPFHREQLDTFETALEAVKRTTQETLARGYSGLLPMLVTDAIGPRLPSGVLRRLAHGPDHMPFVYAAYLGSVDGQIAPFGAAFEGYSFLASPSPPQATPPLFVTMARGRLTFSLCYDGRAWTDDEVREFCAAVVDIMRGGGS